MSVGQAAASLRLAVEIASGPMPSVTMQRSRLQLVDVDLTDLAVGAGECGLPDLVEAAIVTIDRDLYVDFNMVVADGCRQIRGVTLVPAVVHPEVVEADFTTEMDHLEADVSQDGVAAEDGLQVGTHDVGEKLGARERGARPLVQCAADHVELLRRC
jgi:hypothetical protein